MIRGRWLGMYSEKRKILESTYKYLEKLKIFVNNCCGIFSENFCVKKFSEMFSKAPYRKLFLRFANYTS
jgi:hypothetical protein